MRRGRLRRSRSSSCRTTTSRLAARRSSASACPRATIITFWHIPWPNAERFGICPWRDELLRGPARQQHPRLPHPAPLQQLHRLGGPLPRGAHRPRADGGRAGPADDAGPPVPDLHRMAESLGWRPPAPSRSAAPACSRSSGCRPTRSSASASTGSTTRRASRSGCSAVERLLERDPALRGRFTSSSSPRRAGPRSSATASSASASSGWPPASTSGSATAGYRPVVLLRAHHEPPAVFRYLPRRRRLLREQPARRHEPRGQGVRRRARRRARRARAEPVHGRRARADARRSS